MSEVRPRGSVRWLPRKNLWEVRAPVPATLHHKATRESDYVKDPAKYQGAWPSVAGRKAAEKRLAEMLAEIASRAHDASPAALGVGAGITLDAFVKARWHVWLDANTATIETPNRRLRPRVADEYRLVYTSRISSTLGHRPVNSLVPSDLDALIAVLTSAKRKPKPLSDASLRRTIAVLRSILKVAERDGLVEHGTARRFELTAATGAGTPAETPPEATESQMRALMRLCIAEVAKTPAATALLIATATGCRRSEALALKWSALNWETGALAITEGLTERKNGELVLGDPKSKNAVRTVVLPPEVTATLREVRRARPETVFIAESSSPGVPTRPSQAARVGRRLLRKAGVTSGGWHAVRHGWVAAAVARGENPVVVARHAGHSPLITLGVYAGRQEAGVLELGGRMADVFKLADEEENQAV